MIKETFLLTPPINPNPNTTQPLRPTGKGGDGCAAFHREKFIAYGPPSGGDGGRGGDVYFLPTSQLTSLASIPRKITGTPGGHGQGTWQTGKAGAPTVIKVPLGTVVRQLSWDDPRRAKDFWESEEEALKDAQLESVEERKEKMRERRWVHYPRYQDDNIQRASFLAAETAFYQQERIRRFESRQKAKDPARLLNLDLDKEETNNERPVDAPLGTKHAPVRGTLIASGGAGGLGNPHFVSADDRSPKFATRGLEGERLTLSLELKLLADVGLVGMPNAGKSTLLRALTGGRAKTEVAGYAFTTLNPVVGIVRVAEDGTFEGSLVGDGDRQIHDETAIEDARHEAKLLQGEYATSPTRNQLTEQDLRALEAHSSTPLKAGHHFDLYERFRFTIADNPGLIAQASENVGLGHAFLRSIERSHALVYVVDFATSPTPWEDLAVLKEELEKYKPGMSDRARLVVANKADLLAPGGEAEEVEKAKEKLRRLEEWVKENMKRRDGSVLDVVPVSGKFAQNLGRVVKLMSGYVEEQRRKEEELEEVQL